MARKYDVEEFRRAILHRIFLTEVWFSYGRGASLAELTERFHGLGDTVDRTKSAVRYQLRLMEASSLVERWERREPAPTIYYKTTEPGRQLWLTIHADRLAMFSETCKETGSRVAVSEAQDEDSKPE